MLGRGVGVADVHKAMVGGGAACSGMGDTP